nr:hypothetical protein 16 [bacterium]
MPTPEDESKKVEGKEKKSRVLEAIYASQWAIMPEMLETIHEIVANHVHGEKADLATIEAQLGRKLENTYSVEVRDGVAVIPVHGTLAKRMSFFMAVSGGTSTEMLLNDFREAVRSDDVEAILLDIDSPGGTVDGTKALADEIYGARGTKPIVAYGNGLMASAAYWIGSAADHVIVEPTATVGSIGVITIHTDVSKAEERYGYKNTVITAGKFKAIGNQYEPLTKFGRQYIQERLDYLYSIFIDETARNRGKSVKEALAMADGKIFIGKQAVDIGLADAIGSFDDAFNAAKNADYSAQPITTKKEVKTVMPKTLKELKAESPEAYEELMAEAQAAAKTEFDAEKSELEKGFTAQITTLKDEMDKKDERILALEKKDAIREEEARKDRVESRGKEIWAEKLAESDIPDRLHAKVKKMVPASKFTTEDGELDEGAFEKAVDAEIEDWESKGMTSSVIGTGFTSKSGEDPEVETARKEEADDDKWVDEMIGFSERRVNTDFLKELNQ